MAAWEASQLLVRGAEDRPDFFCQEIGKVKNYEGFRAFLLRGLPMGAIVPPPVFKGDRG